MLIQVFDFDHTGSFKFAAKSSFRLYLHHSGTPFTVKTIITMSYKRSQLILALYIYSTFLFSTFFNA